MTNLDTHALLQHALKPQPRTASVSGPHGPFGGRCFFGSVKLALASPFGHATLTLDCQSSCPLITQAH